MQTRRVNPLGHRLQDVGPAADDVGDRVAHVVAHVLAAAVAAEDAAEEIADAADDAADRAADRVDDGVADVGQDLGDDVDELLDETADLDEDELYDGDDGVDQLEDWCEDQLAHETHRVLPPASWFPSGTKDQQVQNNFSLRPHKYFLLTQQQTRRHLSIVKRAPIHVSDRVWQFSKKSLPAASPGVL